MEIRTTMILSEGRPIIYILKKAIIQREDGDFRSSLLQYHVGEKRRGFRAQLAQNSW
jgi:hypothetical protein